MDKLQKEFIVEDIPVDSSQEETETETLRVTKDKVIELPVNSASSV